MLILTVHIAMGIAGDAAAQLASLSGTVTDAESGEALVGASVLLEDLRIGAAAGAGGEYLIESLDAGTYIISVSYIGYRSVNRSVSLDPGQNTLDVALRPDPAGLGEVVVTGIASSTSRDRADISVSRIDAAALQEISSYQNVSQLLTGKVPGLFVQPASGNVAGGVRFVMRSSTGLNGQGQPIIYVDGARIQNDETMGVDVGGQGTSTLALLSPQDIEKIDVLKGPAGAASYGTSGSNGVVLITTKRGMYGGAGTPLRVRYRGVIGSNQQARPYTERSAAHPDLANAFFRNGGISQHSLSVSGGSRTVRYYGSFDAREEDGHFAKTSQDRQSVRAGLESFPTSSLRLRVGGSYVSNSIFRPQNDFSGIGYLTNTIPLTPAFAILDSAAIAAAEDVQHFRRFTGSAEVEYELLPRLSLRGSIGFDGVELLNEQVMPAGFEWGFVDKGARMLLDGRNELYTYTLDARYPYRITDDISATSIVGTQAFRLTSRLFDMQKEGFSSAAIMNIGSGRALIQGDESSSERREAGIYAQQEFAYKDLYFATLAVRRDYASTLGRRAPAIWYPKAGLAMRVDRLASLPRAITFLKLRAAYGEAGQLPGPLDGISLLWQAEPSGYGAGAVTSAVGNEAVKPERIGEFEAGVDAEISGRVGLDFTWYRQHARNSIVGFFNAPSTGLAVSPVPTNVGSATGWGVEVSLSAGVVRTAPVALDLEILWSYQQNEVDDLGSAQPIFDPNGVSVIREGLPRDAFYTWSSRALFNEDGSYAGAAVAGEDADGDGAPDRTFFGTPYPEHNGAVMASLRLFRDVTVSALAQWSSGNSVFNLTKQFRSQFGALRERSVALVQIGLASPEQVGLPGEDIPVFEVGSVAYRRAAETVARTESLVAGIPVSGNFIERADFLRLREISVRYNLTNVLRNVTGSSAIRGLSVTVGGRNLWMTTRYSGADPEVTYQGSRSSVRAQDLATLPQPRVFYTALTVEF